MLESEENPATGGREVLVLSPADLCTYHEQGVRRMVRSRVRGGQAGTAGSSALGPRRARRTLTGVLGQPGSDADLQHFVAGLEDGQVTEALVELHLP